MRVIKDWYFSDTFLLQVSCRENRTFILQCPAYSISLALRLPIIYMIIPRSLEVTSGCRISRPCAVSQHDLNYFTPTPCMRKIVLPCERSQKDVFLCMRRHLSLLYSSSIKIIAVYPGSVLGCMVHTRRRKSCICFLTTVWWKETYLSNNVSDWGFRSLRVIAVGHSCAVLPWGSRWLRRFGFFALMGNVWESKPLLRAQGRSVL